jgi:hypothetical protein
MELVLESLIFLRLMAIRQLSPITYTMLDFPILPSSG